MTDTLKDLFGRLMVRHGDLLDTDAPLVMHQVNNKGVMGAGVAKQIRDDMPLCDVRFYIWHTKNHPERALGKIYLGSSRKHPERTYLNICGQDGYGHDGQYTDYGALEYAFKDIAEKYPGQDLAMPYNMGAGLGGGDWNTVKGLVNEYLAPHMNVTAYDINDKRVQDLYENPESDGLTLPFKGVSSFLSNMYPTQVKVGQATYNSAEGAFQAGKLRLPGIDPALRKELLPQFMSADPYKARQLGRYALQLTPEQLDVWNGGEDSIGDPNAGKFGRMFTVLSSKFSNPELLRQLEGTGDRYLQEDTNILPWGGSPNALGRMLMVIRTLNKK